MKKSDNNDKNTELKHNGDVQQKMHEMKDDVQDDMNHMRGQSRSNGTSRQNQGNGQRQPMR